MAPLIGLHCSHEQIPPSRLLAHAREAEAAGFGAAMSLRPLLAVERAPGGVRLRVVVPRRRDAGDVAAVGVVNAPGPALPPGDRRAGDRDAGRDRSPAGCGSRSAPARPPTSTSRATPGRRSGCATRGCASASTSCARCSPARWSTTTASCASTARGSGRCRPSRRALIGAAVSRRRRRAGAASWADGLVTINQPREHARAGDRGVPRGRRRGQAGPPPGAPLLGADRGRGAADRPRPVAHERLRAAAVLGPRTPSSSSTRPRSTCGRRTCARACWSRPTSARHVAWLAGARRARLRRRS